MAAGRLARQSARLADSGCLPARRETAAALQAGLAAPAAGIEIEPDEDDTLILLFMCCHPALTPSSAIALTLRAVGGLTTAEIARAFLVPEATMAQRISRAKQSIKPSGGSVSSADRTGAGRAVPHHATRAVPDFQRGLRQQRRSAVATH
jgi:predicted RNA polymerase sigma factor